MNVEVPVEFAFPGLDAGEKEVCYAELDIDFEYDYHGSKTYVAVGAKFIGVCDVELTQDRINDLADEYLDSEEGQAKAKELAELGYNEV